MRKETFDRKSWRPHLNAWCERVLHARPERTIFEAGWQSAVIGLHLSDGRDVVVKIRTPEARLDGCFRVHRYLHEHGFPCPKPLVPPTPFDNYTATVELYDANGAELAPSSDRTERFAAALARLMKSMPAPVQMSSLDPPPSWAWWNHGSRGLWPPAGEGHVDLNDHQEATWLRETATRARTRLRMSSLPEMIGHCDWQSEHLLWLNGAVTTVYDWDSACVLPEAAIAGLASVMFAMSADSSGASLAESSDFLGAYAIARGHNWSREEQEVAWAAGVWTMAYNAKGEALDNAVGAASAMLLAQGRERLRRADA
jgi:hypothetical protein